MNLKQQVATCCMSHSLFLYPEQLHMKHEAFFSFAPETPDTHLIHCTEDVGIILLEAAHSGQPG